MRWICRKILLCLVCLAALPASADAKWVYVFGSNGAWARRAGANNLDDATNLAMTECRRRSRGCVVIGNGENGCIALVRTMGGNGYGMARRTSSAGAVAAAFINCEKSNPNGACELQDSICDTTNGFVPGKISSEEVAAYNQMLNRLHRQQRRNIQWGNAAAQFESALQNFQNFNIPQPTPVYRSRPPAYSRPAVVPHPPTAGGSDNCPGSEIAHDEYCRPIR